MRSILRCAAQRKDCLGQVGGVRVTPTSRHLNIRDLRRACCWTVRCQLTYECFQSVYAISKLDNHNASATCSERGQGAADAKHGSVRFSAPVEQNVAWIMLASISSVLGCQQ